MTPRGPKATASDAHTGKQDSQAGVLPRTEGSGEAAPSDGVSESHVATSSTSAESKNNGRGAPHLSAEVKDLLDDLSRVELSSGPDDAALTAASSATLDGSGNDAEDGGKRA